MQFSLAAGSDRAAVGERARAGLGWRGCQQQVPLGCPTMLESRLGERPPSSLLN